MNIDDRGPSVQRWKISNGHVSATGHLIHFMYVRPAATLGLRALCRTVWETGDISG